MADAGALARITPIVITRNEAPNIGRALAHIPWARDIVVVDSFSDDETVEIARATPQVRVFQRRFDSFAQQWSYALAETDIATDWVLALDADYIVPAELSREMDKLPLDGADAAGYRARFTYCVEGRPLRGSLYPPVTVLFRKSRAVFRQDGHAYRVAVDGPVHMLAGRMRHDDRKPLAGWLASQDGYMRLEARKLRSTPWSSLGWADRIRALRVVAPLGVFVHCALVKRLVFEGPAGWHYTMQRVAAETILSLRLLEEDLRC